MCRGDCSPNGLDMRRCASKDAGLNRGGFGGGSHVDWKKERVPAKTLGPKGVDCDVPH